MEAGARGGAALHEVGQVLAVALRAHARQRCHQLVHRTRLPRQRHPGGRVRQGCYRAQGPACCWSFFGRVVQGSECMLCTLGDC